MEIAEIAFAYQKQLSNVRVVLLLLLMLILKFPKNVQKQNTAFYRRY